VLILHQGKNVLIEELPDWAAIAARYKDREARLRSVELSHAQFVLLEVESDDARSWRVVEVGPQRARQVLLLLQANLGRSLGEVGKLRIENP
jgi:hypothetical protein